MKQTQNKKTHSVTHSHRLNPGDSFEVSPHTHFTKQSDLQCVQHSGCSNTLSIYCFAAANSILWGGRAGRPKKWKKKKKALWSAFTVYPSVCTQDSIWLCQLPCFPITGMPLCIVPADVFAHTIRRYVNKKVRLCASIRPRLMLDFSSKCQHLRKKKKKKRNVPLTAQTIRAQKKQMQNFEPHTKTHIMLIPPPQ